MMVIAICLSTIVACQQTSETISDVSTSSLTSLETTTEPTTSTSTTLSASTSELVYPRISNLAIQSGSTAGSITIYVSALTSDTTIRYIITDHEAQIPTPTEVLEAVDYRDNEVLAAGYADLRVFSTLTGFEESVRYMIHVVLERDGLFSEVISRRVLTKNQFEAGTYGTGTYEDPFQIHSAWQLELIATDEYGYTADAHYLMVADIDLAEAGYGQGGKSWVPIGKQNGMNRKFSGVFDGGGHTISNLWIDADAGTEKWGLFQETAVDSLITNIHLTGVTIKVNGFRIAALVGYSKGFVSNVSVTDAIIEQTAGEGQVGAIVGAFYDTGSLYKAYSDATVIATGRRVGGLVGAATTNAGFDAVWIADVAFTGSVTGIEVTSRQLGGILGAGTGAQVSRAYVNATIDGVRQIGGVVGYMEGSGLVTGTIRDCVYDGNGINANGSDLNSTIGIGLILGDASITKGPFEVLNCYSNDSASITTVGSPSSRQTDGIRVPSESFSQVTFFGDHLLSWSFVNIWIMSQDDRPDIRLNRVLEEQS
jgi:hypothetical protein